MKISKQKIPVKFVLSINCEVRNELLGCRDNTNIMVLACRATIRTLI